MMFLLIQILRWLIKPKVWRFVCLSSSVVGLVCYALSSSFNHLFGKWSWWKTLLYTIFSFIICLAVLFAKAWQSSTIIWLKAHLAFLVLIITSTYSFFLDKEMKGRPDAYSLVSYAAFAIMSLGLSRETHCGFEVDLLYFFSGCLIVQLMKIKLLLVIVGGSFSYSLIILRSYLYNLLRNGYLEVQDQVDIENGLHSQPQGRNPSASELDSPQAISGNGIAQPMITLTQEADAPPENEDLGFLVTQVNSHSSQHGNSLFMAQFLGCIEALKKQNRNLIDMISKHVEECLKDNVDADRTLVWQLHPDVNLVDAMPLGIISDLQETAKLMMVNGFTRECRRVYSSCRREFLKECMLTLGLQVQELDKVDDDKIMEKINSWIKAFNVAIRILFPNEWRLCCCIFKESISSADVAFTKVCWELTTNLLRFIDTLATWSHSSNPYSSFIPEVLVTLQELTPGFKIPFFTQVSVSLRNEAQFVHKRISFFMELESLVHSNKAKTTIAGGGLHPITYKGMDYIHHVSTYNYMFFIKRRNSSFSVEVATIVELLESHLEAESKYYTDPTLGYVFMMNNLRYIQHVAKEKQFVIGAILGKDWYRNIAAKIQKNFKLYHRSSWKKVLAILKLDNNEFVMLNDARESMKDKLNLFNLHFTEICTVQSTWFVIDEQLRKRIIKSIKNILLPAYGNFLEKFQDVLGKDAHDYIEYGIREIQDRLNHVFLLSKK